MNESPDSDRSSGPYEAAQTTMGPGDRGVEDRPAKGRTEPPEIRWCAFLRDICARCAQGCERC